jgi:hypothetical protein
VKPKLKNLVSVMALLLANSYRLFADRSATYVQVVNKASTAIAVAVADSPIAPGQQGHVTASVLPIVPSAPTGSIAFQAIGVHTGTMLSSGPVTVSLAGTALWAPVFSIADDYTITATYSGDPNYASSSSSSIETVAWPGSPDFSLQLPSDIKVLAGQSVSTSIGLTPKNGFHGTVDISCTGAPDQSSCNVSGPIVVTQNEAAKTATLSITTAASMVTMTGTLFFAGLLAGGCRRMSIRWLGALCAIGMIASISGCAVSTRYLQSNGTPPGKYPLTITAQCGSITHTGTVYLTVAANGK